MRPIVTDRVAWPVGRSVCRSVYRTNEPCKNGCTDRDAVWVVARMSRRNHVLDGGSEVLRDVAMATNFGTNIAINWLCANDGD